MKMNELTKKQAVVFGAMLVVLAYPAVEVSKYVASRITNATMEAVNEQTKQVTLIVGRVLTINIDGKNVHVGGSDICPKQDSETMRSLFGDAADAGLPECIVVSPTTAKVQVTLAAEGESLRTEEWAVERDEGRVSFRRPNGAPVIVTDN